MISVRRVIQSTQTKFNPAINLNWLAGTEFYGSTLANGVYFDPSTFASGKLFGINDNYISTQSMVANSSAHTALNAPYMSVLNLVSGGSFIALYDWIQKEQTTVVVVLTAPIVGVGTAYSVFTSAENVNSSDLENLNAEFSANVSALSEEMTKDSPFENALESFGYTQYGALGYAAAGIVGGFLEGKNANVGENIAEAVAASVKGKSIGLGLSALGVTNPAVAMAVALGLGALIDEAIEMAMGLDISFGFGGELQSVDEFGFNARFSPAMTVSDKIKDVFGLPTEFDYNFTTNNYFEINSWTTPASSGGEGRVNDLSNYSYGIDVTNPNIQTEVDTSLTNDYFGISNDDNNGNNGYGSNPGDVNSESTGGGGYGKDGTIICTALSRHGIFTRKELAKQFRHTQSTYPTYVYNGYLVWGNIIANKINKGKYINIFSHIMKTRWKYLTGEKSMQGMIFNAMVVGISYVIGVVIKISKLLSKV